MASSVSPISSLGAAAFAEVFGDVDLPEDPDERLEVSKDALREAAKLVLRRLEAKGADSDAERISWCMALLRAMGRSDVDLFSAGSSGLSRSWELLRHPVSADLLDQPRGLSQEVRGAPDKTVGGQTS